MTSDVLPNLVGSKRARKGSVASSIYADARAQNLLSGPQPLSKPSKISGTTIVTSATSCLVYPGVPRLPAYQQVRSSARRRCPYLGVGYPASTLGKERQGGART